MQAAQQCGDTAAVQEEVHALRSSAATVGALNIARRCVALEEAIQAGNTAELGTLFLALKQQFTRAEPLLARLSKASTLK